MLEYGCTANVILLAFAQEKYDPGTAYHGSVRRLRPVVLRATGSGRGRGVSYAAGVPQGLSMPETVCHSATNSRPQSTYAAMVRSARFVIT